MLKYLNDPLKSDARPVSPILAFAPNSATFYRYMPTGLELTLGGTQETGEQRLREISTHFKATNNFL